MSAWIDEQTEETRTRLKRFATVADARYLSTLEALKKAEEALEEVIVEGVIPDGFPLMKSMLEDALKAIEDLGMG